MIFPPTKARAIARGATTTLRIPTKRGKAGAPYAPCPFTLDREYAIPEPLNDLQRAEIKRGDKPQPPAIGHVRIASNHREHLFITPATAKTEGHPSIEAFKRAWVRDHDRAFIDQHALDFNWARYTGQGSISWILLERFKQRWEGREVWVITFELVAEVRYLAQPDPVKAQSDYTRTPSRSIDPLPVIDDLTQERFAKKAREEGVKQRDSFRRDLEAERARRAATSLRGLARTQRGNSGRKAA